MKIGDKEFIALRKEWYKKLKDSGFVDQEDHDFERGREKRYPPNHVVTTGRLMNMYGDNGWQMDYIEEYFSLARAHIHVLERELLENPNRYSQECVQAYIIFAEQGLGWKEIARRVYPKTPIETSRKKVEHFCKEQIRRWLPSSRDAGSTSGTEQEGK